MDNELLKDTSHRLGRCLGRISSTNVYLDSIIETLDDDSMSQEGRIEYALKLCNKVLDDQQEFLNEVEV